MIPVGLVFTIQ